VTASMLAAYREQRCPDQTALYWLPPEFVCGYADQM